MNSGEAIRLQKVIAAAGLCSRRQAERLMTAGQVRVNGSVARELGTRVVPGKDHVEVEGKPLSTRQPGTREVWALYKPRNCISTLRDPEGRRTIAEFFPRSNRRLYPVGRLDYDAEGLILLTDDGDFANRVAHPSHSVAKVYLVKVKGHVAPEPLKRWSEEVWIDGRRQRPVRARALNTVNDKMWCEVELRQGLNRQIKKMFAGLGHPVLKIKRYQIGPVELGDLRPGESRRLSEPEIQALLDA